MIALALLFATAWQATRLPLPDRCDLVTAVYQAKGRRGLQDGSMRVIEMRLVDEPWIDQQTRRGGKTIVRGQIYVGKTAAALFSGSDECGDRPFLPENREPIAAVPNSAEVLRDLVIEIELWPRPNGPWRFIERLRLSRHAHCSDDSGRCGIAVPPARFEGVLKRGQDGSWHATVETASFAS